jgi:hypothetical protein
MAESISDFPLRVNLGGPAQTRMRRACGAWRRRSAAKSPSAISAIPLDPAPESNANEQPPAVDVWLVSAPFAAPGELGAIGLVEPSLPLVGVPLVGVPLDSAVLEPETPSGAPPSE